MELQPGAWVSASASHCSTLRCFLKQMRTIEDGTAGFVSLLFISDTRTARGRLFQARFSSLCLLCVSVKKLVRCLSGFTFHILTLTASSNKRSHGIFHAALLSFVTWPIWSTKCPSYSKQNLVGKVKWCAYGHKTHQGKGVRKQRSTFVLLAAFMSKRALLTWKKLCFFPPLCNYLVQYLHGIFLSYNPD